MNDLRKQRGGAKGLGIKVPCHVCSFQEPLTTAHDHHRERRADGGSDALENRVWLCASCHARLHRVQEFLVQGQFGNAYELCQSIFPTKDKARGELWALAQEAATAEKEVKDAFALHRTTTVVSLKIDAEVWAVIKANAKDRKKSATQFAVELLKEAAKGL